MKNLDPRRKKKYRKTGVRNGRNHKTHGSEPITTSSYISMMTLISMVKGNDEFTNAERMKCPLRIMRLALKLTLV